MEKFSIILFLSAFSLLSAEAFSRLGRPPLNANFVNGPWSRIGKRTQANRNDDEFCYLSRKNIGNLNGLNLYNYYVRCLRELKGSPDEDYVSAGKTKYKQK